jgi:cytidyltransferase-like protein
VRVAFADLSRLTGHALVDGAFDPLHAGHIAYLSNAAWVAQAPLVATIASDDDARAKGREPFLPASDRAAVVDALSSVAYTHEKDRPLEEIIEALRPTAYIKGKDWEGRLPPEQIDACAQYGIRIIYIDTVTDSSAKRLQAWAIADADRQLDALETYIGQQTITPTERFDAEYFQGRWRGDGHAYTLDSRRKAEGRHPKIIKELWQGSTVLDVGCGPGFLVQMLRELGMDAGGIDPSAEAVALSPVVGRVVRGLASQMPPKIAHVVICREVLEHLTVQQVHAMVFELFRLARTAVYITTRFHPSPRSVFDVTDEREVDPTHQTLLTQPFLRSLCVLAGGRRRRDWETVLDHQHKGRVLAYEVVR